METGVLRGARVNCVECSTAGTMSLRGVKMDARDARGCGVLCNAPGTRLLMHGCSVVGSVSGVSVIEGATATLTEVEVRGGMWGIGTTTGGRVDVQGGVVSGCTEFGVVATLGGQVSVTDVEVHHCRSGLATDDSASKITATRVSVHAIDEREYYGNVVVVPDASTAGPSSASAPPPPDRCTQCGAWAADLAREDRKLLKCSRCKRVRYCGRECQRAHWRAGHKAECRARGER